jgi:hypothetical protein
MLDSSPRVIDVQARALELLDGDWAPIPLQRDTTIPEDGWANLQLTEENVGGHVRDGCNIGVVLGKPSGGLTELRLSTEGACIAAELLAPISGSRFRQEGEEYSTSLLYSTSLAYGRGENQPSTVTYSDPIDGEVLVEIRIKDTFTVLPPSVVAGIPLQWDEAQHELWGMPETPDAALIEAAKLIAAVAILAKHWPAPSPDVAAKIKAVEEAEAEAIAADEACTKLAAEPARALALAMAKDATAEQKAAARAAYEAVKADMAIADAALAAAQQRAADTAEKARAAKAGVDTKLATAIGGFLDCAGILPSDAKRVLRCLASLTGNWPDAFDHCVDGSNRYDVPTMSHDEAQAQLAKTPGLAPYLYVGGMCGEPIIKQLTEWFAYDPNRKRGEPSDIPRVISDSSKLTYYSDCENVTAKP